ncbi:VWA domain-containing protein [Hydrogenimonas sp.]
MGRWWFLPLVLTLWAGASTLPQLERFQKAGYCGQVEEKRDYDKFGDSDVYGTLYRCSVQKSSLADFETFAIGLGAEALYKDERNYIGRLKLSDGALWMRFEEGGDTLSMVRQRMLPAEGNLTLAFDDDEPRYYYIDRPEGAYLALEVRLPEEGDRRLGIHLEHYERHGKLKVSANYAKNLSNEYSPDHLVLDLPQLDGLSLMKLTAEGDLPMKVTLRLRREGRLPKLPYNGRLGAIHLKNVPDGMARAYPEGDETITHPDFSDRSLQGDRTPEGDAIFWLPEGYWKLEVSDDRLKDFVGNEAHFIPVFGGRVTEASWPTFFAKTYAAPLDPALQILDTRLKKGKGVVDFSLLNAGDALEPKAEDFTVHEAGARGKVLGLERLKTPPEVVILLDSSGSMKRSMRAAKKATADFIAGLPKRSRVYLIDFDTRPKLVSSKGKKEALKALKKVRANGATALYDAVKRGMELLEKANRPVMVLFTDGKDANYNDTGPGSTTRPEEIFDALAGVKYPVFTIGFGAMPDRITLDRIASLTGGSFYEAAGAKELAAVYDAIRANLGHQYRLTFRRPAKGLEAETPVVLLMIDNSGSMEEELERVRQLVERFVARLPEDCVVQMGRFSEGVKILQIATRDKPPLIRSIAEMEDLYGTAILDSVEASYNFLRAIPSSRRYLFYLTDEAIDLDGDERVKLETVLKKIRDEGIQSFWVGMADDEAAPAFRRAAKWSGGEATMVKRPEDIAPILDRIGDRIEKLPKTKAHEIRVTFRRTDRFGRHTILSDAVRTEAPLPIAATKHKSVDALTWKKGGKLQTYDGKLSKFVSGSDVIGRQVRVLKRIPLKISAANEAVRINLDEAVFLSRLRGIDAPDGWRYMAIVASFENILKPQKVVVYPDGSAHPAAWVGGTGAKGKVVEKVPDYLIPDARVHLFLRWNNTRTFPLSDATELAQKPLIAYDGSEIFVPAKKRVTGTLIFLVPDEFMKQSSLHFYDTAYGHIDLPISGIVRRGKEVVEKLPETAPKKLSDTFSFTVKSYRFRKEVEGHAPAEGNLFLQVNGSLLSRVNAHLAVEPSERIRLAVETEGGEFVLPMHPLTKRLPFGFYESRFVTPGSFNEVAMLFEIPKALEKYPTKLLIDLKGGAVTFDVTKGKVPKAAKPVAQVKKAGTTLTVHGFYTLPESSLLPDRTLIVDMSVADDKDGNATELSDFLGLKLTEEAAKRFKHRKLPKQQAFKGLANFSDNRTAGIPGDVPRMWAPEYILSFGGSLLLYDGRQRRVLALFRLPDETTPKDFTLVSNLYDTLDLPCRARRFPHPGWLTKRSVVEENDDFATAMQEALEKLRSARAAAGFTRPGAMEMKANASLDGKGVPGIPVEPPSLLASQKSLPSLPALKKRMKAWRIYPSNGEAWSVRYAPEAVAIQKWCTENEIAEMAEKSLNARGIATTRLVAELTPEGIKAACRLFAPAPCRLESLPALRYEDEKGKRHTVVIPFFKESWQLKGLVAELEEGRNDLPAVTVEVVVRAVERRLSGKDMMALITDSLAGDSGDGVTETTLLSEKLSKRALSLDMVDLGFYEVAGSGGERVVKAMLRTPEGTFRSDEGLSLNRYEPMELILRFYDEGVMYESVKTLSKEIPLTDRFFVYGLNTADLPPDAAKRAEKRWKRMQKRALAPDALSVLRWAGRKMVGRFVAAQTRFEREAAKKLGIGIRRIRRCRIVGASLVRSPDGFAAAMDLVDPYPQLTGDPKKRRAFNIAAGLFYTRLEGEVTDRGIDALDIWAALPKEAEILYFDPDHMEKLADAVEKAGYPAWMVRHFEKCRNHVLFPSRPLQAGKGIVTAWMEVEPESYRIHSYLSNGDRGMVDYVTAEDAQAIAQFYMGVWMGVQASVWSVASYSLILDDYKAIKKAAKKYALSLADHMGQVFKVTDVPSSAEEVKQQLEEAGMTYLHVASGGSVEVSVELPDYDSFKDDLKERYLGFENGFKAGVALYFAE